MNGNVGTIVRLVSAVCLLLASFASDAFAPAGRYTTTNDTVTDTVTALTWQRNVSASTYTWSEAQGYCSSLSLGGWSSGWRLPTVKELRSIVDVRTFGPAIDAIAFPSTPQTWFWSSTPSAYDPTYAWVVVFYDGGTQTFLQSNGHRARCVR